MSKYTVNGMIEHVMLGTLDYGYMSLVVGISCEGKNQSFGTHDLRYEKYGIDYLAQFLNTIDKSDFCDLVGSPVRVKKNGNKIIAIGHYLKDKWFEPENNVLKINLPG